jgi:hypothetical protein
VRPRAPRYENLSFDSLLAASHAGGPMGSAPAEQRSAGRPGAVAVAPVPADDSAAARSADDAASSFASRATPAGAAPVPPDRASEADAAADTEPEQRPAPVLPTVSPVDGHPLTRRELRAMLQAQAANQTASANQAAEDGTPDSGVAGQSHADTSEAPTGRAAQAAAAVSQPDRVELPASVAEPAEPMSHRIIPPATTARRDDSVAQTPITAVRSTQNASAVSPVVLPETFPDETADERAAGAQSGGHVAGPATDPQLRARAAGHWSTMGDDEDATGGTPRSAVSTGSVTTANALILPSIPATGLATSPLTSTGEVMVTGSIDLPKSLGATGQHPDHFDTSDIDRLFEESDAAPATSGVAPVRASKAVATHTSTRGMITPPKARGNRLPVVLAVTAAFLALGVAALLVAGFVFHAF